MMHSCFLAQRKVAATIAEILGETTSNWVTIGDCKIIFMSTYESHPVYVSLHTKEIGLTSCRLESRQLWGSKFPLQLMFASIRLSRKIFPQTMHSCFLAQRKVAATVGEILGEKTSNWITLAIFKKFS